MSQTDKYLIGVFLILLLTSLYTYVTSPTKRDQMFIINGSLAEQPDFTSSGGDFKYEYLRLRLKGYDEYFYCRNCSYKALNLDLAQAMSVGDSVKVKVTKNGRFYVFGIESISDGLILDNNEVIRCESNTWRKTFYLSIVAFALLVFRLIFVSFYKKSFRAK